MSSRPLLGEFAGQQPDETITLRKRISQLEADLRESKHVIQRLEVALADTERPLKSLRRMLSPFRSVILAIFNELDAAGISESAPAESAPAVRLAKSAVWDRWMNQLGGNRATMIRTLLEHGEMTRTQLRVASGIADGSLNSVATELVRLGLINRGGGKYSLKELP